MLAGKVLPAGGPSKIILSAGKGVAGWAVGVGGRDVAAFSITVSVGVGDLVGVASGVVVVLGGETAVSSPPHK